MMMNGVSARFRAILWWVGGGSSALHGGIFLTAAPIKAFARRLGRGPPSDHEIRVLLRKMWKKFLRSAIFSARDEPPYRILTHSSLERL